MISPKVCKKAYCFEAKVQQNLPKFSFPFQVFLLVTNVCCYGNVREIFFAFHFLADRKDPFEIRARGVSSAPYDIRHLIDGI